MAWLRADPGFHVVPVDWAKRRGNARFGTQAERTEERRLSHGSASRSFGPSASHHVIRSFRRVTPLSTRSRRRRCWVPVKARGSFIGRPTSRVASVGCWRPKRGGKRRGDFSAKSSHPITTSHGQSRSRARDTGILQDRDSVARRRPDPCVGAEEMVDGGRIELPTPGSSVL
jgi:hypothetical protein